jgi:hypothetical protein
VDLTAVAAFTAAALSLVNVVISYRLTSRGHREQSRRDQERPIVARSLTLSADALGEWWDASVAKQDMAVGASAGSEPHWEKGCVSGMFIWPQIDDQRQRSLATAGVRTTNTSEAVYMLTAVGVWPGQPLPASEARHGT